MNAIEYFKKNGLDKSKIHLEKMNAENWHNGFYNDLKQIVDAFDLVGLKGGLISANKYLKFLQSSADIGLYHGLDDVNYETEIPLMEKTINLVEQCQCE